MTNKNSKVYKLIKERDELKTLNSELTELEELKKIDPLLKSKRASILLSNLRARESVERDKIAKMVQEQGAHRARMVMEQGIHMFNLRTKLEKARLNLSSDNTKKRAV